MSIRSAVILSLFFACAYSVLVGSVAPTGTGKAGGWTNVKGNITLTNNSDGNVTVTVVVEGIAAEGSAFTGFIGIHVHSVANFTGIGESDGTQLGGHLNLGNTAHGCPEAGGDRHTGDMGLWTVNNGVINQSKSLNLLTEGNAANKPVVFHGGVTPENCTATAVYGPRWGYSQLVDPNPTSTSSSNTLTTPRSSIGASSSVVASVLMVLVSVFAALF